MLAGRTDQEQFGVIKPADPSDVQRMDLEKKKAQAQAQARRKAQDAARQAQAERDQHKGLNLGDLLRQARQAKQTQLAS